MRVAVIEALLYTPDLVVSIAFLLLYGWDET